VFVRNEYNVTLALELNEPGAVFYLVQPYDLPTPPLNTLVRLESPVSMPQLLTAWWRCSPTIVASGLSECTGAL
jgi:hypothetical protein